MKKIQDEIYEYFDNQPIPELDQNTENKFKELVAKNKPKSKAKFWKKFAIISSISVCCLLCLVVPLIALLPNTQPTTNFYTDDEATKIQMTEMEFNSFIQENFPQYNFLVDDFEFQSAIAFYEPNSDNLLAINFISLEILEPYTYLSMFIVLGNNFHLSAHDIYVENAIYTKSSDYELYKKNLSNLYDEYTISYIIFSNYRLYIQFDCINDALLERFL